MLENTKVITTTRVRSLTFYEELTLVTKKLKLKQKEIDRISYDFINDLKGLAVNLDPISIVFVIGSIQVTIKGGQCEVFLGETRYGDCPIGKRLHFCQQIPTIKKSIRAKLLAILNESLL